MASRSHEDGQVLRIERSGSFAPVCDSAAERMAAASVPAVADRAGFAGHSRIQEVWHRCASRMEDKGSAFRPQCIAGLGRRLQGSQPAGGSRRPGFGLAVRGGGRRRRRGGQLRLSYLGCELRLGEPHGGMVTAVLRATATWARLAPRRVAMAMPRPRQLGRHSRSFSGFGTASSAPGSRSKGGDGRGAPRSGLRRRTSVERTRSCGALHRAGRRRRLEGCGPCALRVVPTSSRGPGRTRAPWPAIATVRSPSSAPDFTLD